MKNLKNAAFAATLTIVVLMALHSAHAGKGASEDGKMADPGMLTDGYVSIVTANTATAPNGANAHLNGSAQLPATGLVSGGGQTITFNCTPPPGHPGPVVMSYHWDDANQRYVGNDSGCADGSSEPHVLVFFPATGGYVEAVNTGPQTFFVVGMGTWSQ